MFLSLSRVGDALQQFRPHLLLRTQSRACISMNAAVKGEAVNQKDKTGVEVAYKSFHAGRAVRPHDFTSQNRVVSTRRRRLPLVGPPSPTVRHRDPFYQLKLDPLSLIANPTILSHYVTEMGKIKPRTSTSLTVKSQRKLGKAIRRAKMMGIIPNLSKFDHRLSFNPYD